MLRTLGNLLLALLVGASAVLIGFRASESLQVTSGERIIVVSELGESKCRISILDNHSALTAGHCGGVGSIVQNEHGRSVGQITDNFLYSGKNLDAAVVQFSQNVKVQAESPSISLDQESSPNTVWVFKGSKMPREGTWERAATVRKTMSLSRWRDLEVNVIEGRLPVKSGDSGAPVFDSSNKLAGIIQGGNTKGLVNITPAEQLFEVLNDESQRAQIMMYRRSN